MSIRGDIEAATTLTLSRLNAAHNYYAYSILAWRTVETSVKRDGNQFVWENPITSSRLGDQSVPQFIRQSVISRLASSTFQQFVSIFENFLFDVLRLWLTRYPDWIARRQITGREILSLPDKASIIDSLVEKELRDVFYDRPARWFEYLDERAKLGVPSVEERQLFAEVKATRDVLVHGLGIASPQYVDKAGPAARAAVGEILDVPEPYHQQSWELTLKLAGDIGLGLFGKA